MKTPNEIKKGLDCCQTTVRCSICPYTDEGNIVAECSGRLAGDALEYIIQLESRLAQVERERDALLDDLHNSFDPCTVCKKQDICEQYCPDNDYNCPDCKDKHRCTCHKCAVDNDLWEWRGICSENAKEE